MVNIGYTYGRLCALLEYLHAACKYEHGRISNVSLCCQQPLSMQKQFNNAQRCLAKMPEYEALMADIVDQISADTIFPTHLNIADQGQFTIAYYTQKNRLQTYRVQLGCSIMRLRADKGLSQQGLANLAEVDKSNINKIENGRYSVGVDILYRIARALDCELKDFF